MPLDSVTASQTFEAFLIFMVLVGALATICITSLGGYVIFMGLRDTIREARHDRQQSIIVKKEHSRAQSR